jgi:hypothetical protein
LRFLKAPHNQILGSTRRQNRHLTVRCKTWPWKSLKMFGLD